MAEFYGTVTGRGATQTTTGTKSSGIRSSVQSWGGSLITEMSKKPDGTLMIGVSYSDDSRSNMGELAYYGTFKDFIALLEGRK